MSDGAARRRLRCGPLALLLVASATGAAAAETYSLTAVTMRSSTGDVAIRIPPTGFIGTTDVFLYVPLMGFITDVNVHIRANHTFDGDLEISLLPPIGNEVLLINRRGGGGDNFGSGATNCAGTQTVLDHEAATAIAVGAPPFAGSFIPDDFLPSLNALTARGTWRLRIRDHVDGDSGTLYCFTLEIAANPTLPLIEALIDVDGDGMTSALSDGFLMLRWLFGFRGSVLIADAVAAGCTRCTAAQIEAFLQALDLP